ncbi:NADH-quinone oxidoreductase subunit N [Dissulfurirhabdus thermomarina]|uniref:NADH-quinone oxidoreductase subunit N n=1 Tax=Dissulfurirhabdus thermomarina TaxID=1765737 RepID=A0A6N9TPU6_DISTH|nr:NADH-quinone oxidoreductase subunit N [Dissulfurirhabdus thermomarina]NDY41467.1 NADH-quinone oxidoreductase subunit N [Dissulfurirhabdus thermomarina]NMX24251.1 NADH-quinone oxidoreductase subunit N [Dissulfurirhabdus thermomarina]
MTDLATAFNLQSIWNIAGGQVVLLATGLVLIALELLMAGQSRAARSAALGWATVVGLLLALGHVVFREWTLSAVVLSGVFSMEKFTVFLVAVLLLAGVLAALMSIGYLRNNEEPRGEYFILLLFSVYGAVAFVQSVDLLMMFIALEVMSVAVYVLAAYLKNDRASVEGAMKYFLLGSFGSAFFLFGVVWLYGLTGTLNLSEMAVILSGGLFRQPPVLVAFAMLSAGLFFKMALVPFHMWTPDVYEGSPSVVTGFMATAVKAGAFGAFLKILTVAFSPILSTGGVTHFLMTHNLGGMAAYWQPVLWWLALLTMFIGNLLAISQQNIKRMLAYSSIAHAGYMTLGLLAGNADGRMGVLFYLFSYTLMNLGAFGVVYLIDGRERGAQTLEDYRGLGFRVPGLSFLLSLFLVAMAGLPPTAGFIGKFYVFAAAIREGYLLLAALGILTSVMGAYYYLRVVYLLYMKDPVREVSVGRVDAPTFVALAAMGLGVLYLGILPQGLARLAQAAQASLAYLF